MAKKRKCRYTAEELAIHEEAVRLRKMTDRQLVEEFHRSRDAETASKGAETSQGENTAPPLETLLHGLSEGKCKGVKGATVYKIQQFAMELGLI